MTSADPSSLPSNPLTHRTLRRLFLTLFLRGRGARGISKKSAPKSVGQKLSLSLLTYFGMGFIVLALVHQPLFAFSAYLHAMTFVFLGMFVANSAGEILFNQEEADILLHRPVSARDLLWAKVRVIVEVSLWLACALNLAGMFGGVFTRDGNWGFPLAHAVSTVLEALFCTGVVILVYQLCLRWFGRERLDGLMTLSQIVVSVAFVMAGEVLPRLIFRQNVTIRFDLKTWWIALLPPAWFAGLDDALVGTHAMGSWALAGFAVVATAVVMRLVFGKLARDYGSGLQQLSETSPRRAGKGARRRWIDALLDTPPFRWWMRDSVSRAAFLLVAAYLTRDRDVKLRVYPALAPMLVLPLVFLFEDVTGAAPHETGKFGLIFISGYLGVIPMMALDMLKFSQQWRASDLFRAAPMPGPGALCNGARRAVITFLVFPLVLALAVLVWLLHHDLSQLLMLLPGIIVIPVFAMIPNLGGRAVPFSLPSDEARASGRGVTMMAAIFVSMALAAIALFCQAMGWFWFYIPGLILVSASFYWIARRSITNAAWPSLE
jgi:ABC-2 type transport system permease protein